MASAKGQSNYKEYAELNHRPTSSTFLKFSDSDQTPVIQSVIYFDSQHASNHFIHQLNRLHSAAAALDYPHIWPYQVFHHDNDSFNVILEREFFNDHLSDRLLSRPFLDYFEKSWYGYQLVLALIQMRQHSLFHLDINSRNVLTTCWGWLVFADFAFHKPSQIPADNSHMFSLFYDAGDNRTCTLAPERFSGNASNSSKTTKQNQNNLSFLLSSDIFSAGCVLAEIFLDGEPLFTLSNLHKYRHDKIPPKSLSKIPTKFRKIVQGMIDLDPKTRFVPEDILSMSGLFPDYFPELNEFMGSLLYINPNRRLEWISLYLDNHPEFFLPPKFLVHFSRFLILCASPNDLDCFVSIVNRVQPDSSTIEQLIPYLLFSINPISENPAINRHPSWRSRIFDLIASLLPLLVPSDSLIEIITDFIFPFLTKHLQICYPLEYVAILKLLPLTKLCPLHENVRIFFDSLIHSPLATEHPCILEGLLVYLGEHPSGALGHFIHENLLPVLLPIMNSPPKPVKKMYLIQDPVDPSTTPTLHRNYTSFSHTDDPKSAVLLSPITDIHRSFKFLFYSILPLFSNFLWENDSPYILPLIIQGLLESEPFIVSHAISTLLSLSESKRLGWQDFAPLAQFLAHNVSRLENSWIRVPFINFLKLLYAIKPNLLTQTVFDPILASVAHVFGGSPMDPSSLNIYNSWVSFVQPQTISAFRSCFINSGSPIPLAFQDSITLSSLVIPQSLPFSFKLPSHSLGPGSGSLLSSDTDNKRSLDNHSGLSDYTPKTDTLTFTSIDNTPLQIPDPPPLFITPTKDFFAPLLSTSPSLIAELASHSVPSILYEAKRSPLDKYRISGGKISDSLSSSGNFISSSQGSYSRVNRNIHNQSKEKPFLGCTLATMREHSGVVSSICTVPFSTVFASGSSDGTVKLWNFSKLNPPLPKVPTSSFASIPISEFTQTSDSQDSSAGVDDIEIVDTPHVFPHLTGTSSISSVITDLETLEGEYLCIGTASGILHTLSLNRGTSSTMSWCLDRSLYSDGGIEKLHTFSFDPAMLFISNSKVTSTYDFRSSEPSLHFEFPELFDSTFVDLVHFENTWSVAACFNSGAFSLYDLRFPVAPVTLGSSLPFSSVHTATGFAPCLNKQNSFAIVPAGLTPQTGIFCTFGDEKYFPSLSWDRKFIFPDYKSETLTIWDLDKSSHTPDAIPTPMWQSQTGLLAGKISSLGRIQTDTIPAIVLGRTDGTISLIG